MILDDFEKGQIKYVLPRVGLPTKIELCVGVVRVNVEVNSVRHKLPGAFRFNSKSLDRMSIEILLSSAFSLATAWCLVRLEV